MKEEENEFNPVVYSEKEMETIENHIEQHFGKFDEVFHEIISPDIHVDICVVNPTKEKNYYTLVTMGMGAHVMNVPKEWQNNNTRAEILVTLPPDWNLKSDEEADYWPLRWLKILARLPISEDTWLGWGHTVPNGEPFAENTELSGVILELPYTSGEESPTCKLPNGDIVNFYQMIPLYEEEMNYKVEHGTDELFDRFDDDFTPVIDIQRKNYLATPMGTPGKTMNLSRASRSAHIEPDPDRLKEYDIYIEKSKKDKLKALFWVLIFGGVAFTLISKGYGWWALIPGVFVLYNLFSLIMQLIATPKMAFSSGLLIPGIVVETNPVKVLAMAEMQNNDDAPVCWGLKVLTSPKWPETNPQIGERIPCVSLFGGSYKGVWVNMEPRPLIWGTGDKEVLNNAISAIDENEWEIINKLKDKALNNSKIENDVVYFNKDLTEKISE